MTEELVPAIDFDGVKKVVHTSEFFWDSIWKRVETRYNNGMMDIRRYCLNSPEEMEEYYTKYPDKRPTK